MYVPYRAKLAIPCFALLAAAMLLLTGLSASAQPERVVVAFHGRSPDAAINSLLSRHGLYSEAVFTWTSGLTGTYRAYGTVESPESLIASARAALAESYVKGVEANVLRLERFTSTHTRADVEASEPLTTQGRTLLNVRAQLELATRAAERGDALIYAVELLRPTSDQLDRLALDPLVRAVNRSGEARGLKPAEFQPYWWAPGLTDLGGGEVYDRMLKILGSPREASSR